MKIKNPYWGAVKPHVHSRSLDLDLTNWTLRSSLVGRYAWTITDPDTVDFVREHITSKVIDPMAGSGYWAWLLRQQGVDILASDVFVPDGSSKHLWHPNITPWISDMKSMDAADALASFTDRVLLLSWPHFRGNAGSRAVSAYHGNQIIYIGEIGEDGCCGDSHMWEIIKSDWEEVERHVPVHWNRINDRVVIYKRKE